MPLLVYQWFFTKPFLHCVTKDQRLTPELQPTRCLTSWLFGGALRTVSLHFFRVWSFEPAGVTRRRPLSLYASPQCIHQVDNIVRSWFTRRLDFFALFFFAQ